MPKKKSDRSLNGNFLFKTRDAGQEDKEPRACPPSENKKRKRSGNAAGPHDAKHVVMQAGNDFKHAPSEKQTGMQNHMQNAKNWKPRSGTTYKTKYVSMSLKEKAEALYEVRKSLPIFPHADEIRQHLRRTDVMLLAGETGSGKSTQVPQFLITEDWCLPKPVKVPSPTSSKVVNATVGGCIAITEPRRVAAISLARRVADEMGTPLGSSSPASKVGYSVRFDTSTSPSTKIKFLTEGMLLQEMLRDPWLRNYSAVIVDEVHERGVNVDLILGLLRNMVSGMKEGRGGVPLKIVVMSATADMEALLEFFSQGLNQRDAAEADTRENRDGSRTLLSVRTSDDSESEWSGISSDEEAAQQEVRNPAKASGDTCTKKAEVCRIKGRQHPVEVIYTPEPVEDFVDAALNVIFQIHVKEPLPGDILVFLTGQETVESLEYLVNEYALGMDKVLPKILVLPLFAALPQAAQQRVFLPAPPRTRKIVLATNIAETSVTVSGVRYVIDCGKAKMKHFRTRLGLDSLLVRPISKSAAIQRKGRAGREAPGQCYRLYTEKDYLSLEEVTTPEILRCDISQAILIMKARGVNDIMGFPFLTRPSREALEKALLQLFNLQALDETGKISSIGLQIAKFPLSAPLGRVLLAGAENGPNCLHDVIDIISCLSVENIFLSTTSEEGKEEAEMARRDLFRREGDHLTMLATVRAYAAETTDRKAWAERHMVSHRAMQAVMDVRKQLTAQCLQARLLDQTATSTTDRQHKPAALLPHIVPDEHTSDPMPILKSFLAGFATNTARLLPDGSYRTMVGNQTVAIHPSSILYGRKIEAIMYNEFVFTNRSYARGVSAVQMDWVGEVLGR